MVTVAAVGLPLNGVPAHAAAPRAVVAEAVREQVADGGSATFWVTVAGRADLSGARAREGKAAKGGYVRTTLIAAAERSQASLRGFLRERRAAFQPYWIANALRVTGDRRLVDDLARRTDVVKIEPDPEVPPIVPARPEAGKARAGADPEWNIQRIKADRVWNELGVRGEGVVVANIDTGVWFQHPALLPSYRGTFSTGRVNHNYNWFDASGQCPGNTPCDEEEHGTHVMGIEVGAQQVGVAPGARWIAARAGGLDEFVAAGQWMLAPTDLTGANPRPELAPDVINNSWRVRDAPPGFYGDVIAAWIAAGIFPVVAAGNDSLGGACETMHWPPSLAEAYTVANATAGNEINPTSSRGPASDGRTKPDISAPGSGIRSTQTDGEFAEQTGTSQAAPHVAGAVALLWSAAPALKGDIAATRRLLDDTAGPIPDLSCGGTAEFNNVAGHGMLDVYKAVQAAPRADVGGLRGVVRRAGTGRPLPDATVRLSGPRSVVLTTDATGTYRLDRAVPGTYTATASAFGHAENTTSLTVRRGKTLMSDLTVRPLAATTVTGVVHRADGLPAAGAVVTPVDAPVLARTDADGRYRLDLPLGRMELRTEPADRCALPLDTSATVAAGAPINITLPLRTDAYGHTCTATGSYRAGTVALPVSGRAGAAVQVALPFAMPLYGQPYTSVWVAADGVIGFSGKPEPDWGDQLPSTWWVETLPRFTPEVAVFPFHSRLDVDAQAGVFIAETADAFVVEWRNVRTLNRVGEGRGRISFSATLHRDGSIEFAYRVAEPDGWTAGRNAVVGLTDINGDAFAYSDHDLAVNDGLGVTLRP
ncbi:peptidase S8 [Actinoplanes sp. NBRC 103695]|nr:peptidase S8 [Actinoplanes sp. NBRC 103695]